MKIRAGGNYPIPCFIKDAPEDLHCANLSAQLIFILSSRSGSSQPHSFRPASISRRGCSRCSQVEKSLPALLCSSLLCFLLSLHEEQNTLFLNFAEFSKSSTPGSCFSISNMFFGGNSDIQTQCRSPHFPSISPPIASTLQGFK